VAGAGAQSAAVAKLLIYFYDLPFHHSFLLPVCFSGSPVDFLKGVYYTFNKQSVVFPTKEEKI
jgi:hypothetical protein